MAAPSELSANPDAGHEECLLGVNVKLPYKPYGVQRVMMATVIRSLKSKQNCIIESPTGTGKTMALLCATLAWYDKSRALGRPFLAAPDQTASPAPPRAPPAESSSTQSTRLANSNPSGWNNDNGDENNNNDYNGNANDDAADPRKRQRMANQEVVSNQLGKAPPANRRGPPDGCVGTNEERMVMGEDAGSEPRGDGEDEPSVLQQNLPAPDSLPRIYFITRTHAQLAQTINELNLTHHKNRINVCTLASRKRSCINEPIIRATARTGALNAECQQLVANFRNLARNSASPPGGQAARVCPFYRDMPVMRRKFVEMQERMTDRAWDIEDAKQYGLISGTCPYYGTRLIQPTADLTLCPYNYIFNASVRSNTNICLAGSVLIFDEAHNIEDICRDCASFETTSEELRSLLAALEYELELIVAATSAAATALHASELHEGLEFFKPILRALMEYTDSAATRPIEMECEFPRSCVAGPDEIESLFATFGLASKRATSEARRHLECVRQASHHAQTQLSSQSEPETSLAGMGEVVVRAPRRAVISANCKREPGQEAAGTRGSRRPRPARLNDEMLRTLAALVECASLIYGRNSSQASEYKLVVLDELHQTRPHDHYSGGIKREASLNDYGGKQVRRLQLMCLNPRVLFDEIAGEAWSVVAASGTLAPVDVFCKELGCNFQHIFQGNHVVDEHRCNLSVVSTGPTGVELNGCYNNARSAAYKHEVGRVVLDVCKRTSNGVLCFISSYAKLNNLLEVWQADGILDKIMTSASKCVFREARSMTDSAFERLLEEYRSKALGTGAILFAVHRGKASEGVNFANGLARAVISIGVPFSALKDHRVSLKKQFNDERAREGRGDTASGADWYTSQALRALFQAIGRCIRHQNDWGAVIIIDSRMVQRNYTDKAPRWLRARFERLAATSAVVSYDTIAACWARFTEIMVELCEAQNAIVTGTM